VESSANHMWKDNNSIDLSGIGWHGVDWIDLA
jgi:hypothetical protein